MRFRRKHKRVACLGCVTLTMIALGAAMIISANDDWGRLRFSCWSPSEEAPKLGPTPKDITLTCSVRYERGVFAITNGDSFPWVYVRIQINQGVRGGVYELFVNSIESKTTHKVRAGQFARGTATRFTPSVQKPKNIYILADTPDGEGHWSTTFD